jgi:glycosyltransferase involved in cell wall biosynthesis
MKILLISPQPFFRIRGTPINVKNVAQALLEDGHTVHLLCYPFGSEPDDMPGLKLVRGPGFPGIRDVKIGPSLAKIPLDFLLFIKAWSLCRKERYDMIHTVEEAVFFGVWLKKWFKTRLIYDMDSVISDQLKYSGKVKAAWILKGIERMEAWAIRNSEFVLTVCASLSDTTRRLVPGARIFQIEDAPVDAHYAPSPEIVARILSENALEDHEVVVYTGNLESYQGVDLILAAAPLVLEQVPRVKFLLVGGNTEQIAQLTAEVEAAGIQSQVIFAGIRPINEMSAYMEAADLLISPRKEGSNTALKIYSYMQSGKGIVATDMPTHTQVLDQSCAELVGVNAAAMAAGIVYMLSNKEIARQRGLAAAQRVEEYYSLAQFKSKVIAAYQSIDTTI